MVDLCTITHSGKANCADFWKGPVLISWYWCAILICLGSVPGIHTTVSGDVIVAHQNVRIHYGSPMELLCSTSSSNYSSKDLEFRHGRNILDSQIVNRTTIRYYVDKPELQKIIYSCTNVKSKKLRLVEVLVDNPPPNVLDFKCISFNLDVLNCTWRLALTYSLVRQNLTFDGSNKLSCKYPQKFFDTAKFWIRSCTWNISTGYRPKQEEYHFTLKSENDFGHKEENFTLNHFSIVKPDAPTELSVIKTGAQSVKIKWVVPNNIHNLLTCGVDHKIEYQIVEYKNTFQVVNTLNLVSIYNNNTYEFLLSNLLYAHKQYKIRLCIKSKKDVAENYWSDFAYVIFWTTAEKPHRPPDTVIGAFYQSTFDKYRLLYIYWKQIEEYEENGPHFTYKVFVTQRNEQEVYEPSRDVSMSYVRLNNGSFDALHVNIFSTNANGSSENSSYLYIPPLRDTRRFELTSLTKLAYANGTYDLSWVGINDIDNYTLFWCQYNTPEICSGQLNFTIIDGHINKYVVDLPREYRYQFAISANNGSQTSGMVWAKCDISNENLATSHFSVQFKYDSFGKSFAKLRWSIECVLQDGIISGYSITYCPVIKTHLCDSSVGKHTAYIDDPTVKETNITDLLPFRTYQFNIALNTSSGLRIEEKTTVIITTLEDTPSSPRNILLSYIKSDSLNISWDPPLNRNGMIVRYIITDNSEKIHIDAIDNPSKIDLSRRSFHISGLIPFTNHSLTVQACTNAAKYCSEVKPGAEVFVRTATGPPGPISQPAMSGEMLIWDPPSHPGGEVIFYEVQRKYDDNEYKSFYTNVLKYPFSECDETQSSVAYRVRAFVEDKDPNHGILSFPNSVILPVKIANENVKYYYGDWSIEYRLNCNTDKRSMIVIDIVTVLFAVIALAFASVKIFSRYKKKKDIKPKLPIGLGLPEKHTSQYPFGVCHPIENDDQDETSLLKSKTMNSSTDIKPKYENGVVSIHTDSTDLYDSSSEPMQSLMSASDEVSDLCLELKDNNKLSIDDDKLRPSLESTQYCCDSTSKESPESGYVQPSVCCAGSGYVKSAPPKRPVSPPAPIDVQAQFLENLSKIDKLQTNALNSNRLPILPTMPLFSKTEEDTSNLQLAPFVRNKVLLKLQASNGYVSNLTCKPNTPTGVQPLICAAGSGYVQSAPAKHPLLSPVPQPTSSSYVMAGIEPSVIATRVNLSSNSNAPPAPTGNVQPQCLVNLPKIEKLKTSLNPNRLPILPTVPSLPKTVVNTSYIQLQPPVPNNVPLKPQAPTGYVSLEDPILNNHIHVFSATAVEELPILDPTLSKDIYCQLSLIN